MSFMSLFTKGKEVEAVLFSPLEGKITYQGKPVTGAKIKLKVAWKDQDGETEFYQTDNQGNFNIPKKTMTYTENPLVQLVIKQRLTVFFENQEFYIWRLSKMEEAIFTELGGRPINLICELTNDERTVRGNGSLGGTRCTWDALDEAVNLNERN